MAHGTTAAVAGYCLRGVIIIASEFVDHLPSATSADNGVGWVGTPVAVASAHGADCRCIPSSRARRPPTVLSLPLRGVARLARRATVAGAANRWIRPPAHSARLGRVAS